MKKLVKNIALFLLAPFIGLVYVAAVPIVATGAIVYVIGKAVMDRVVDKMAVHTAAGIRLM